MRTIVLGFVLAACCSVAIGEDKLIEQLDADYKKLLAEEDDPSLLRQAERFLEGTNQSSRWTDYNKAVTIIRKSRSKAGIPLLLKYAIKHAGLSSAHVVIRAYGETLVILSGDDVKLLAPRGRDRAKAGRDNVEKLVVGWWNPNKKTITTDLGKMKSDNLRRVIARVAGKVLDSSSYPRPEDREKPERVYSMLSRMLRYRSSSDRQYWYRQDLDAAMVPGLLAMAGYVAKGSPDAKAKGPVRGVTYEVIPLLAALRKDGEVPNLDKIGEDRKQPSAVRLTCMLAVHASGEELRTEELRQIIKTEKSPAIKVPAILALPYASDYKNVTSILLDLMDDPNADVCTAATYALSNSVTAAAVPRLKKIIDKLHPPAAVYPAIRALGKIKTADAGQTLVDFITAASQDAKKARYLSRAMSAFRTSTGCPIRIPAGRPKKEVVAQRVQQALEWWRANKKAK